MIFDATSFTRRQRDDLRRLAAEAGAAALVAYVPIARAEAERRLLENRIKQARRDVRDEDFAQVADNFGEPAADEAMITMADASA